MTGRVQTLMTLARAVTGSLAFVLSTGCGDLLDGFRPTAVSYRPSGDIAAISSSAMIIYDGDLGAPKASLPYGAGDVASSMAGGGRALCAGGDVGASVEGGDGFDDRLVLFEIPGGSRLLTLNTTLLTDYRLAPSCDRVAVAYARDGMLPIDQNGTTVGWDNGPIWLEVYRLADGALLWSTRHSEGAHLAFSPDGARLFATVGVETAAGYETHVRSWNAATGELLFDTVAPASVGSPLSLASAPDGSLISAFCIENGLNCRGGFAVWSGEDGTLARTVAQDEGFFPSVDVVVSPDGAWWLALGVRGFPTPIDVLQIWSSEGTLLRTVDRSVVSAAFSPDSTEYATLDSSDELTVYRVSDGAKLATRSFDGSFF